MMKLNNKGFAFTTIIYAIVLMLGLAMILVFGILRSDAISSKDFGNEVDRELEKCIMDNEC